MWVETDFDNEAAKHTYAQQAESRPLSRRSFRSWTQDPRLGEWFEIVP